MKIRSITAIPFRIPFRRSLSLASGARVAAEHVLVQVETEDGVVGTAEATPRPTVYGETVVSVVEAIERLITPRLIGLSVTDFELARSRVAAIAGNPTARSSVEVAAYDALGRTLGISCARLLGGFADQVQCAPLLPLGRPGETVEAALGLRERYGVTTFKFKIGTDLRQDIETARLLRMSLGDSVAIYPDANQGYSGPDAMKFVQSTSDCGLAYIEEPCSAADFEWRARVAKLSVAPVVGDESCFDLRSAAAEVWSGRSTAVSLKLARTGISGSTRIRNFCEGAGVATIIGSQGDSLIGALASLGFAASAPTTATSAAEVMFFLELEENLTREDPEIVDGVMRVPEAPGFGFEIDAAKLQKYALDS